MAFKSRATFLSHCRNTHKYEGSDNDTNLPPHKVGSSCCTKLKDLDKMIYRTKVSFLCIPIVVLHIKIQNAKIRLQGQQYSK